MERLRIDIYTKKRIIIFLIFIIITASLWGFLYSLKMRQVQVIKQEINRLDNNFAKIQEIIIKNNTIKGGLLKLQDDHQNMRSKFPGYAQDVIKELSPFSLRRKVVISSVTPRAVEVFKASPAGEFKLGADTCKVARFSILAYGNFMNIGDYFAALASEFPFAITIESFNIRRSTSGNYSVQANIELSAYLISK